MKDSLVEAMLAPIKTKPQYLTGQTVRVLSTLDVNMPASLSHWLGAKCTVIDRIPRGLISKEWYYELKHPNGRTCEFSGDELDARYRRHICQPETTA